MFCGCMFISDTHRDKGQLSLRLMDLWFHETKTKWTIQVVDL